ncbi:ExbB\TolQ family transport protein [Campylobacter sputorum subsp. bubulus]|uniref:ExbB\TolQ family transport protein n=1 Tax=Campylobacter sputorum subsp. sputorum TaxID=32024 RepID=A0A381DJM2_9BACT|nr:MotA/TolQ/ExbB proton channel family protein [Campylobacter sputorum]ASM35819.1 Tol-Pal system subunit TolQ [Campylobacter sputorum aubsp. sputorum RM3237]KAB0581532.1 MotA/TolQ/ExbB proton channel family protein [Campylobacter sputorum subsp. sputorum]QEL06009.1 Tol-Pal system subunit TolQ [Campylobacter sputorum subsp. sputorum]SUX09119.1 ExbB\TolQ family transport protein [Campylobacter sputorum subsp. bubulus]SUX10810.1 ExbB\TolQ family transport protein [Campylobacter sputorum subsp. s
MGGLDIFFDYFLRSSFITIFVLTWLSIYFIVSFTILISRLIGLKKWISDEQSALESLLMGSKVVPINTILKKCTSGKIAKEKLNICISKAQKNSTSGLTWLSIIASTSPFIGLFGTVVSILETFSKLGQSGGSISVIAPAISEALVATGCGIFVAIPAYTFHLILKRKSYELMYVINNEADIILANSKED